MDLETPVDAWYVWLAVSIVSAAVAAIALGFPTGPSPDANRAANTIEQTAGSPYQGSSTADHDATAIKFDGRTVAMRNEHGTTRATLTYGHVVPVMGDERLENVAAGRSFEEAYAAEIADPDENALDIFLADIESADAENSGEWQTANGPLRTRTVTTTPVPTISAAVDAERVAGDQTHEVTLEYESSAETGLRLLATGSHDTADIDERVTGRPASESITLTHDEFEGGTRLSFPIDVTVEAGGTGLCTETIRAEQGDERVDICRRGGTPLDVATDVVDNQGYVAQEGDSFYVTLVTV